MKCAAMFVAMIVLGGMLLSICVDANAESSRAGHDPEYIWRSSCGYCHGGAAGAPELRGRKLPAAAIMHFARKGAPGMPAFHASEISDADLRRLAEWISNQPGLGKQP